MKIYSINTSGQIKLNHGGWKTVTTKKRINEASEAFMPGGMGFKVYQDDFEWYVKRENGDIYHWEGQLITFNADPNANKKEELEELASAEQSEAMWEHRMLHGSDY